MLDYCFDSASPCVIKRDGLCACREAAADAAEDFAFAVDEHGNVKEIIGVLGGQTTAFDADEEVELKQQAEQVRPSTPGAAQHELLDRQCPGCLQEGYKIFLPRIEFRLLDLDDASDDMSD